jgi:hypothetical protein
MYEDAKARRYDALMPGTGVPEAQATERMERRDFKEERRTLRRTSRNRGIIVPELPWKRGEAA